MGCCSWSESLVEKAEVAVQEETPGSPTVLETDCNCCPHHMTSYHPKPLETVSLRGQRREGLISRQIKKTWMQLQKKSIWFFSTSETQQALCLRVCVSVCLVCVHWQAAQEAAFTGVAPPDSYLSSKHSAPRRWTSTAWATPEVSQDDRQSNVCSRTVNECVYMMDAAE